MKAREGKLAQDRKQEVSDLRDDGSIFSNEKALVLLSDKEDDENLENESSSITQYLMAARCQDALKYQSLL